MKQLSRDAELAIQTDKANDAAVTAEMNVDFIVESPNVPYGELPGIGGLNIACRVSAKETPVPEVYSNLESEEEGRSAPGIRNN